MYIRSLHGNGILFWGQMIVCDKSTIVCLSLRHEFKVNRKSCTWGVLRIWVVFWKQHKSYFSSDYIYTYIHRSVGLIGTLFASQPYGVVVAQKIRCPVYSYRAMRPSQCSIPASGCQFFILIEYLGNVREFYHGIERESCYKNQISKKI